MYLSAIFGGIIYFSWGAFVLFIVSSGITLCFGHSIGMHRKLIHSSFDCPLWLEQVMVYLGTLVGLGGPFTMTKTHDMRDWAQRQSECHDYYGHRQAIWRDGWWQIHCDIHLHNPPEFRFDQRMKTDRFYLWLEKTAIWQQLPWALLFFFVGGWGWLFWGVCARVAVGVTGHWLVGYFAHNRGGQHWKVDGASVQGYDVKFCGLITFGECWHNNHHAFPGSARLGLCENQFDPGWLVLQTLKKCQLVSNLKTPADLPNRPELLPV
ncbi:acyl-CoA desaturase [bacterium SCSIO 12696]|nr:acyl-CoA desaturase [bacterium SCSIO 12696]